MAGETLSLFEPTEVPAVAPAVLPAALGALAARLPAGLHLGTSSWSFPGWAGTVYARPYPEAVLAREGLAAYARHPLLRAVGLDRSYYAMPDQAVLEAYARATPPAFRFVVKAPELCTLARFHAHPRHGARAGQANPRFLDPAYAAQTVVGPLCAALGARLGVLVFQFPPQPALGAAEFLEPLASFLAGLPVGPRYAVEVREAAWLTRDYAALLAGHGVGHCLSVHPRLPPLAEQARIAAPALGEALTVRWNLHGGYRYEQAKAAYAPFDRLREPDPDNRALIARLGREACARGLPVFVTVNNKAEGCAPASVAALAEAIAGAVG